jgi:predicted nuclease of predicted toxin-antitoxin system
MRLLADAHVSSRTVEFLRTLGHDVQRVVDVLPPASADEAIVELAASDSRIILTQDLDFSAIIALRGESFPSLISLRLSSSRVEHVNGVLERILPQVEAAVVAGSIVTVEDQRIRVRSLPLSS